MEKFITVEWMNGEYFRKVTLITGIGVCKNIQIIISKFS